MLPRIGFVVGDGFHALVDNEELTVGDGSEIVAVSVIILVLMLVRSFGLLTVFAVLLTKFFSGVRSHKQAPSFCFIFFSLCADDRASTTPPYLSSSQVCIVLAIMASHWKMSKKLGIGMFCLYLVFVAEEILRSYGFLPKCVFASC